MKYDKLFNFIKDEMVMAPAAGGTSFFYQPIMIRTLLKKDGKASREEIEEDIKDEYHHYQATRKNPNPFEILIKHSVCKYNKSDQTYELLDSKEIQTHDKWKAVLVRECNKRITEQPRRTKTYDIDELGPEFQAWMETDDAKEWMKDHEKHAKIIKDKLSREAIKNLGEKDLLEIYEILWSNNNFTNKTYVPKEIIKNNGLEKIRTEITELVYGTKPLSERFDGCKKNLKGMGTSALTELLYCYDNNKYVLWNAETTKHLKKLGLEKIVQRKSARRKGEQYEILIEEYTKIVEKLKPFGAKNFFDIDCFLYEKFHDVNGVNQDTQTYWTVAAGRIEERPDTWADFKRTNTVGISWNKIGDLSKYLPDELKQKFQELYPEPDDSKGQAVSDILKIKSNDIIFVNDGKRGFFGICRAVGGYKHDPTGLSHHQIPVEWISQNYVSFKKMAKDDRPKIGLNSTICRIKDKTQVEKYLNMTQPLGDTLDDIFDEHKQIILYGPPGTSKTRTAKEYAIKLIDPDGKIPEKDIDTTFDILKKSNFVEMVQFHPSYSYEDFVEGIRPSVDSKDKSKLTYEVRDGIFRKFCARAYEASKDMKDRKDHHYAIISNYLRFEPINPTTVGSKAQQGGIHNLTKPIFQQIVNYLKNKNFDTTNFDNLDKFSNFLTLNSSKDSIYTDVEGFWYHYSKGANAPVIMTNAIESGDTAFAYYKIGEGLAGIGIIKQNARITKPPYVLIIDEINRGDPARIFGELIYALEYRDRGITTQYSEFDEKTRPQLIVPDNLYVIGTMNTADRSISLFDVALRRRFAFKGLFPDYNLLAKELGFDNFSNVQNKKSDLDNVSKDDRIKLLSILALHEINTKIVDPEHFKLGRERQVGHTYLLPKKNNSFNFVSNWKYDIIPLLEEFFFAKANVLQKLFTETIFSEKGGIKDFDEDELIASLKSIVTKQEV